MHDISARFDDLTENGGSFMLADPVAEFVAHRPGEVVAALRAAEHAAHSGRWVAGFVAYEAAAGLDAGLVVAQWTAGHAFADLPLVWFAAFDTCRPTTSPEWTPGGTPTWRLDGDEHWHRHGVTAIRTDIAAGRYYQVNLTARLSGHVDRPEQLYTQLSNAQRGRYNCLITCGAFTVVSSSPELFFQLDGRRLTTRPMKGTARRGRWPGEDRDHADALRASTKECAENVMIVDLLRNDVGRVARIGTVRVPALFVAERYPTVWQLTSTVEADTDADLTGIFSALFPSGSVTGAPKAAAMAAIVTLETHPRGVYCGAIGYLEPGSSGRKQFSVAIRTAVRDNRTGYTQYGTGGGITWPSDPAAEWDELIAKTRVLAPDRRPSSLLETLRFEPGRGLVNIRAHLRRLAESAEYFDYTYRRHKIFVELRKVLGTCRPTARVRIVADQGGQIRVDVSDLDAAPDVPALQLAHTAVRSDDVLLFHKTENRSRYQAFRDCCPDADDVVLWNEHNQITETTTANITVLIDGRWWTPPLTCGLLPGVERSRLLASGLLAERVVTVAELQAAEEVAVVSSLRGWRAAELRPPP